MFIDIFLDLFQYIRSNREMREGTIRVSHITRPSPKYGLAAQWLSYLYGLAAEGLMLILFCFVYDILLLLNCDYWNNK